MVEVLCAGEEVLRLVSCGFTFLRAVSPILMADWGLVCCFVALLVVVGVSVFVCWFLCCCLSSVSQDAFINLT